MGEEIILCLAVLFLIGLLNYRAEMSDPYKYTYDEGGYVVGVEKKNDDEYWSWR